ncbi:MAG: DUF805 domain-containing protein [Candidatus Thalassarchaeaceae archaeon]|jgi:uncharacterized membrane protein YhaH (DUF805 family)|nr:DUF805 domain-containing protein [Candidatus Thalassarchaeaceae archaeon]
MQSGQSGQPQTVIIGEVMSPFSTTSVGVGMGRPLEAMSFSAAIWTCMSKSFVLEGRASRSEFWWFWVFTGIYGIVSQGLAIGLAFLIGDTDMEVEIYANVFSMLFYLPVWPAVICSGARRMHDNDLSGWWQLVPFYNLIVFCQEGDQHPNQYGPVPDNGNSAGLRPPIPYA